ncbi:MAG TPA: CNNM domain-containing protein [Candidatus Anammoximicrobium sp.]|nr:CNNM domain-containing protein [Candidatus Anammoximicrobium sp.]
MTLFILSVLIVLIVSAFCSLSEAALYAVRSTYIRQIAEQGSRAGQALSEFRENMEQPITAILIFNTAANTAGAAVAGAQAHVLFGESSLLWFSLSFTVAVLLVAEIIPKVLGVACSRSVATAVALPWAAVIKVLYPLIWGVQRLSRWFKPEESHEAPEEEVRQLAQLSAEEGSILPYEAALVSNVLRLDKVRTRDIMTPRPVVFKLASDMTLREVSQKVKEWTNSRVPVYDAEDPEIWKGFVFSRDILSGLAQDQFETTLDSLCRPLFFVSEKAPGHVLLRTFLTRRTHLFGVVDEFGDITGIVTLEDVMESLLGEEIVDEADSAVDMQAVAKQRMRERLRKTGRQGPSADRSEKDESR